MYIHWGSVKLCYCQKWFLSLFYTLGCPQTQANHLARLKWMVKPSSIPGAVGSVTPLSHCKIFYMHIDIHLWSKDCHLPGVVSYNGLSSEYYNQETITKNIQPSFENPTNNKVIFLMHFVMSKNFSPSSIRNSGIMFQPTQVVKAVHLHTVTWRSAPVYMATIKQIWVMLTLTLTSLIKL